MRIQQFTSVSSFVPDDTFISLNSSFTMKPLFNSSSLIIVNILLHRCSSSSESDSYLLVDQLDVDDWAVHCRCLPPFVEIIRLNLSVDVT